MEKKKINFYYGKHRYKKTFTLHSDRELGFSSYDDELIIREMDDDVESDKEEIKRAQESCVNNLIETQNKFSFRDLKNKIKKINHS
jgi:hypothetical protein